MGSATWIAGVACIGFALSVSFADTAATTAPTATNPTVTTMDSARADAAVQDTRPEAVAGSTGRATEAAGTPAAPLTWKAEVDTLLAALGRRTDWVFIRNGSRHTADEAVAHMRLKWKRQDGRIRSTEEFIAQCATRSSFTGRPYRIRLPDGRERDAADVLREELGLLRRGHASN